MMLPLAAFAARTASESVRAAMPSPSCSVDLLGGVEVPSQDVGKSGSPEANKCNGLITIVRAVGVHPKIVDPFIAAAFACLLLLLF